MPEEHVFVWGQIKICSSASSFKENLIIKLRLTQIKTLAKLAGNSDSFFILINSFSVSHINSETVKNNYHRGRGKKNLFHSKVRKTG